MEVFYFTSPRKTGRKLIIVNQYDTIVIAKLKLMQTFIFE